VPAKAVYLADGIDRTKTFTVGTRPLVFRASRPRNFGGNDNPISALVIQALRHRSLRLGGLAAHQKMLSNQLSQGQAAPAMRGGPKVLWVRRDYAQAQRERSRRGISAPAGAEEAIGP
jgi:hypothetical protein